jgi:hypothetical protein
MYKQTIYLPIFLPNYLRPTSYRMGFQGENPGINSVEVHPQPSHHGHPVDSVPLWVLVHSGRKGVHDFGSVSQSYGVYTYLIVSRLQ